MTDQHSPPEPHKRKKTMVNKWPRVNKWSQLLKFLENEFDVHFPNKKFVKEISGTIDIKTEGDDLKIEFSIVPGVQSSKISGGINQLCGKK